VEEVLGRERYGPNAPESKNRDAAHAKHVFHKAHILACGFLRKNRKNRPRKTTSMNAASTPAARIDKLFRKCKRYQNALLVHLAPREAILQPAT
jgi:hypothetical protein